MPLYSLMEYSDNYSKTSGSLCQYYRDEPSDNLADSESFKSKIKITGKTPAAGNEKDVEIMVPLKYLSNFWRTLDDDDDDDDDDDNDDDNELFL